MIDTELPARTEAFPCNGAIDILVAVDNSEVEVELADVDTVTVAIYAAADDEAVRLVKTHFTRGRLVVHATRRTAPVRIVVRARPGSRLHLTGSTATFTVTGAAGSLKAEWGSGDLTADTIDGPCRLRGGNGVIHLGASNGDLNVRMGACDVSVDHLGGRGARLTTGSGTLTFGTVESDLSITSGDGSISVADAAAGHLSVRTGPADVRIGVRSGVTAKVDLRSRSGSARSDLPVSGVAPAKGPAPLRIDVATSSGDILVTPAG